MRTAFLLSLALVALVALSADAADPEISDKVFFDIEMGGKPAGMTPSPINILAKHVRCVLAPHIR